MGEGEERRQKIRWLAKQVRELVVWGAACRLQGMPDTLARKLVLHRIVDLDLVGDEGLPGLTKEQIEAGVLPAAAGAPPPPPPPPPPLAVDPKRAQDRAFDMWYTHHRQQMTELVTDQPVQRKDKRPVWRKARCLGYKRWRALPAATRVEYCGEVASPEVGPITPTRRGPRCRDEDGKYSDKKTRGRWGTRVAAKMQKAFAQNMQIACEEFLKTAKPGVCWVLKNVVCLSQRSFRS
jgi:hypothetical protein